MNNILDHNWLLDQFRMEVRRAARYNGSFRKVTMTQGTWGVLLPEQQMDVVALANQLAVKLVVIPRVGVSADAKIVSLRDIPSKDVSP